MSFNALPKGMEQYTDPSDFNRIIYHQRSTDADERMKQILADANRLLSDACQGSPFSLI